MQASAGSFIKKETLVQVFSSQFYEIFQNTYSIEHLWGDYFQRTIEQKELSLFYPAMEPNNTAQKNWNFLVKMSSVNVTKSAVSWF